MCLLLTKKLALSMAEACFFGCEDLRLEVYFGIQETPKYLHVFFVVMASPLIVIKLFSFKYLLYDELKN